ncbi:MAG: ChaN family lipoprotein [Deltaproteobacteria bacterium]|nr:MAG: ChaN family lipoprotein [Deltaproteobacteria bacterium]
MKSTRDIRFLGVACLITFVLFGLPPSSAADSLPHHNITISFDLSRNRLYGVLDASLPGGVPAIRVGRDLSIKRFSINGKRQSARVRDGRLDLPDHHQGVNLQIEYEGVFDEKEGGTDKNTIGEKGAFLVAEWYPTAEATIARFALKARIPKEFHAVSEANVVSVQDLGSERLVNFEFRHPVPRIHFVMAPYVVKKDRYGEVEVATYFLPEDQDLSDRYLERTVKYLQMYEKMLGPYPYQRFAVVANITPTGYGMPTFTLLGRQVLRLPFIPETSLGHEILHSWFGNSVYVDYDSGNWSEGLTSYLADNHYEELLGDGWQYRRRLLEEYESYVHGDNEITLRQFVGGGDRAQRAVGYGKSAMVFHMLRNRIDDEHFFKALRLLVWERRFRLTSWQDLAEIFSREAGQDLNGFFDFWLDNKGMMKVSLNRIHSSSSDQEYQVTFTARVKNSSMPVTIPVAVNTAKKTETHLLSVSRAEQRSTLFLKAKSQQITVDADYDLFRSLTNAERRPVLSRLLGDPTRTVVIPETGEEIYHSLIQVLESWGFKAVPEKEADHELLSQRALLYLGPQPELESVFPRLSEAPTGFFLRIRKNMLNPKRVLGLVLAENRAAVGKVAHKLSHYGQYSKLEFSGGKNVEKDTGASERGIVFDIPEPARGIALESLLSLPEIISRIANKSIVYVGERHDRYGDHLVQLEVIRALDQLHPKLAIGMEMFERRYQRALDDYILGAANEQTFLKESHYFSTWRFNYNLYRDILRYAKTRQIPVIALNQDHELVSKVADKGLEGLTRKERERLPVDMVFDDEAYEQRLRDVFEMHQVELPEGRAPHAFEYFHQAQILWDETMAETIANFLEEQPDYHLVVLAGTGHLAFGSGIPSRVHRRIRKDYSIVLPDPGLPLEKDLADHIVFPGESKAPEAPKLGVMLEPKEESLTVTGFAGGSDAEAAGMEEGDTIVAVDDHNVNEIDDLRVFLATKYVGDKVRVKILRGDKIVELTVELGAPIRSER